MRQFWILAVLVSTSSVAWADHLEQTVSFQCDQAANRLVIEHHGAFNEDGDRLVKDLRQNEWNIRTFLPRDKGGTAETWKTVERSCKLRGGVYEVTISGVAWDKYGGDQSAHITIIKGKATLFDGDLDGSPFSGWSPIVTCIVVSDETVKPQVSTTAVDGFWVQRGARF